MTADLTQVQRNALVSQFARGRAKVLAIGVDGYNRDSGFAPLKTCRNDAIGFANCFRDIPQLNADPEGITTLVTGGGTLPSRGEIIMALRRLAQSAIEDDRLIFYFGGHGHRIAGDPEVYLVPQDVFAKDDPTGMIALSTVVSVLRKSAARQRLVIVDAGLALSGDFLDAYLGETAGIAVVCCSAEDATARARSPDPRHGLFAAVLLPALRGTLPAALDDRLLMVSSLFRYLSGEMSRLAESAQGSLKATLKGSTGAAIVLADFSGPLLGADALGPEGSLFERIELSGRERTVSIKDILTSLQRTTYTQDYLEDKANAALGGYLEEGLGQIVSRLRATFKWGSSEVSAEDGCIVFPYGSYAPRYQATAKLRGMIVGHLSLEAALLEDPSVVGELLSCFGLNPDAIRFVLRKAVVPGQFVPKLEANGWELTSELAHKVEARRDGCELLLQKDVLVLTGLPLRALFAAVPQERAAQAASSALAIFGP